MLKSLLKAGVLIAVLSSTVHAQSARIPLADCSQAMGPCVDKIDPPEWWAGLPSPMLLLHGVNLRAARMGVKGNGVRLERAQVSENGHYAFLWLRTENAAPQKLMVLLTDGKKNLALPYTLAA